MTRSSSGGGEEECVREKLSSNDSTHRMDWCACDEPDGRGSCVVLRGFAEVGKCLAGGFLPERWDGGRS